MNWFPRSSNPNKAFFWGRLAEGVCSDAWKKIANSHRTATCRNRRDEFSVVGRPSPLTLPWGKPETGDGKEGPRHCLQSFKLQPRIFVCLDTNEVQSAFVVGILCGHWHSIPVATVTIPLIAVNSITIHIWSYMYISGKFHGWHQSQWIVEDP